MLPSPAFPVLQHPQPAYNRPHPVHPVQQAGPRRTQSEPTPPPGSLEWLLGFGLTRTAAAQTRTTVIAGPAPFAQPAQKPVVRPSVEPVQSLRDQARLAAADMLRDGFKARLRVVPAAPGASPAERWAALQKSMATTYLLGLPVSREVSTRLPMVEQWTPQQVFGCSAGQLAGLLRRLAAETLAELGVDRIPPGEVRDEMAQAARDFRQYVGECLDNVGEMRRADGSRRQVLTANELARIRYFHQATTPPSA